MGPVWPGGLGVGSPSFCLTSGPFSHLADSFFPCSHEHDRSFSWFSQAGLGIRTLPGESPGI